MSCFLDREALDGTSGGSVTDEESSLEYSDLDFSDDESPSPPAPSKSKKKKKKKKRKARLLSESESESEKEDDAVTHKKKKGESTCDTSVMVEVRKTNKLLVGLVRRVKKQDKRLKQVESQLKKTCDSYTPGSTPKRSRKKEVPDEVRVSVHGL